MAAILNWYFLYANEQKWYLLYANELPHLHKGNTVLLTKYHNYPPSNPAFWLVDFYLRYDNTIYDFLHTYFDSC